MSNLSGRGTLRGALGGGGGTPTPTDIYWDDILEKPNFSTVATSGSYNDLTDKPPAPTIMTGATAQSNGASGYVPQPLAGDQNKILNGAGEWVMPQSSGVNYSTDEQVIGTWIDGKPLYQKTIFVNITVSTTNWTALTNITDGQDLIDIKAYGEFEHLFQIGIEEANIDNSTKNLEVKLNNLSASLTRTIKCITIQYTKTTDTIGG